VNVYQAADDAPIHHVDSELPPLRGAIRNVVNAATQEKGG
jgi:hypothetical protein